VGMPNCIRAVGQDYVARAEKRARVHKFLGSPKPYRVEDLQGAKNKQAK
jgi:hypothetical protein